MRLLVVDDDENAREVMARVLGRAGYDIDRSDSVDDAMFQIISAVPSYDAVLVAFTIGGIAPTLNLLEEIRSHADTGISGTRVIAAPPAQIEAEGCWEAGVDGYASRPIYEEDLLTEIRLTLALDEDERESHREAELVALSARREGPHGLL